MNSFRYPPVSAADLLGGCCLTSVGISEYGKEDCYPVAGHPEEFNFDWERGRVLPDFALVLIVSGRGEWQAQSKRPVPVVAGDALFIAPGAWHRYRPEISSGWSEKWITLRGSVVHGYERAKMLPENCTHRHGGLSSDIEKRLDQLINDVLASPGQNRPSWGARALSLLLECFGDTILSPDPADRLKPDVHFALQFIRENAHRPIGLKEVAAACRVERRTLERHFKNAGLETVGRHIVNERLSRAGMLLSESGMQVKEIAYACGFGNVQRMIYDFKKYCGVTPGKARRNKLMRATGSER